MSRPAKKTAPEPDRVKLSGDLVAEQALALIDEVGLDNFSFRSLAKRLGCQAMSIYHYFPSKAHLYEALVGICLSEVEVPGPERPWRDRLRGIAMSMREVAIRHPGFFLYFAIFRMNNREGLAFLNGILRIFEETGLDTAARARQFRSFSYYIMGAGLDESLGYAHGPSAVEPVPQEEAERDFPAIMAVGRYFGDAHHREIYEYGVDVMLDRMAAEATAARDARAG